MPGEVDKGSTFVADYCYPEVSLSSGGAYSEQWPLGQVAPQAPSQTRQGDLYRTGIESSQQSSIRRGGWLQQDAWEMPYICAP